MKKSTPESAVVKVCLEWFKWRPDIGIVWRINNTGIWHQERKIFLKPKNLTPGFPDIVGVRRNGVAFFIECKSEKGKLSENQKAFRESVIKCGCEYIVVRSVDDLHNYPWDTSSLLVTTN